MTLKVFLSYSAKDSDVAKLVKAKIKDFLPQGDVEPVDVIDIQTDLAVGQDIRKSIKSAIESAQTVFVISSESTDSSTWVNYEVGLAEALGKELVIVERKLAVDSKIRRRLVDSARIVKIENG